ncbi:MAG: hypothetical protein CSA38_03165 [Flavobacteriales bacterium]|nr:MAG: hypothetical protein CSA38_03165 [Flavobacteriales bacterium]
MFEKIEHLYFKTLKSNIEQVFLLNNTPSSKKISEWKGIDIIYFQEDLRKKTKVSISEKSFYNYFKRESCEKLPRIDILNALSQYVGCESWVDFKKNNPQVEKEFQLHQKIQEERANSREKTEKSTQSESVLQNNTNENQLVDQKSKIFNIPKKNFFITTGVMSILLILTLFFVFKNQFLMKKVTYTFTDADRNSSINNMLSVRILKENESPISFKVKPNEPFIYKTKSSTLRMVVSSPFYKTDTIDRNLEKSKNVENIELKPNDYAIMLHYYSKSIRNVKKKRNKLNRIISKEALIYQVYDNEKYGVEILDKQKYINLVTTPTTSLKNLEVIDTQMKNGKITLIKFKIKSDDDLTL